MAFELKTWHKVSIGIVVFLIVVVILYYVFGGTNSSKVDTTSDPANGRPPFYSKGTWDFIQQHRPESWSDPSQDMWGAICSNVSVAYGGDKCHAKIPGNNGIMWQGATMAWFKGMNIAPDVNLYGVFRKDIEAYINSGFALDTYNLTAGEFIATAPKSTL